MYKTQLFNHNPNAYNIIFLDIDGVLIASSDGTRNLHAYHLNEKFIKEKLGNELEDPTLQDVDIGATLLFSIDAVNNLKTLLQKRDAKIVISSNWRLDDKAQSIKKLRALFKLWDLDTYIIDVTPKRLDSRGDEIKEWLETTKLNIRSFVILDDRDDYISDEFPRKFINTEDRCLFSTHHLKRAMAILEENVEPAVSKSFGC